MEDNNLKLTQFTELTGCPIGAAIELLEVCQWNVQNALDLYYESGTIQPSSNTVKSPQKESVTKVTKVSPVIPAKPKQPVIKPANSSPYKDHDESQNKPEKLILSGAHDKFNDYRAEAKSKNRWLLILLTSKKLTSTILKRIEFRDFTNTRFVPLEISREETDGQWFSNAYKVENYPFFAILDPITAELFDKHEGEMTSQQIQIFLKEFLNEHPEKGRSVDMEFVISDLYNYTNDSSSEKSSNSESDNELSQNSENSEKQNTDFDPGPIVKVMIQLPNNKRTKIEIGENEKIKVLYKKVSTLTKKNFGSFKLVVPYPTAELNDMEKTILEMKLKNSMIRVDDVV